MAEKNRTNLKTLFGTGNTLSSTNFADLIDSFVSTKENSTISGSLLPSAAGNISTFNLGSSNAAWNEIFISSGSLNFVDADGTVTSFSKDDFSASKADNVGRSLDTGVSMKRITSFNDASTFIDLNTTARGVTEGTAIDIKIKNIFEALHLSEDRISIGPTNNFPIEITGSLDVKASSAVPHKLGGLVQITGETQGLGTSGFEVTGSFKQSGSGGKVEFKPEGISFTDGNVVIEDAIVAQSGVINQSISIGTDTSPSVADYIGVGDDNRITIASNVIVNIAQGSRLIIKKQQPNISADNNNGNIVITDPGGGQDLVFSIGSTGTNPQFIDLNMNIPSGNYAKWYGPIFVGRKLVGELDETSDKGSLRINSKSQLVVQDF
jgi:hypothetical protein